MTMQDHDAGTPDVTESAALQALISQETDIAALRAMLARMRKNGNLRWVIALCDRIATLSPTAEDIAAQVWALLAARDVQRVRAILAELPADMGAAKRILLEIDLAEAQADPDAFANLRQQLPDLPKDHAARLTLREVAIRLGCGDLDGAASSLAEARTQSAPATNIAECDVRLSLLAQGPVAALAVLDSHSETLGPSSDKFRALRLRLLNARGRWSEVIELALAWMDADSNLAAPPPDEVLAQALLAAMMADRLSELKLRLINIESHYPAEAYLVEALCICAIEDDDTPLIDAMMAKMQHMNRWRWLGLAHRHACHSGATKDVDALCGVLRSEGCLWPGPEVMSALYAYYFEVQPARMAALLDEMQPLFDSSIEDVGLQALRLRLEIGLSRDEAARGHLAKLPKGLRACAELRPFQMYFDARDGQDTAAREGWQRWMVEAAPIATEARVAYPVAKSLRFDGKEGAILCFVCIFNGIEFIDWFLDHYRALGVDHFFFCDNASTDGTAERLMQQADVSLFHASDSFAASGCGIFWINHLMRRYGVGHWCVHVDMDEALVFPGLEQGRTLRDLTRYLDAKGHGCTESVMIDMVPPNFPAQDGAQQGDFAQSNCFDPVLTKIPCELPPYALIKGGMRSRLTGRSLLMTKSPLVRMTPDFAYLVNNHHHTHLPVSDVTTAVLHYKFIGAFRARLSEAISRREHFQGARFYRQLDRSLDSAISGQASNMLVHYEGPPQLVTLGLLSSSPDWDNAPHDG